MKFRTKKYPETQPLFFDIPFTEIKSKMYNEVNIEDILDYYLVSTDKTSLENESQPSYLGDVMPSLHSEPKTKDDMLLEILAPLGTEIPDPTGEYADLFAYLYDKISPLLINEV